MSFKNIKYKKKMFVCFRFFDVFGLWIFLTLFAVKCDEVIDLNKCLPADLCNRLECPPLPSDCKGIIRENASICGCCPICVTLLDKGDLCWNAKKPYKGKRHKECKKDLICTLKSGRCESIDDQEVKDILPICLRVKRHRTVTFELFNNSAQLNITEKVWMPNCDVDGFFEAKQCKHSKCFCVNKNGQRIFGQMEQPKADKINMNCGCSRDLEATWSKPLLGVQRHCSSSGDYAEVQCLGGVCFCANKTTGEPITSQVVKMKQINLLPCKRNKTETYLSGCEKEAIREGKLYENFRKKGITSFLRRNHTICDLDGKFPPKHCTTQACYCTDREGNLLRSYASSDNRKEMHCRCARDEHDVASNVAYYPEVNCNEYGNADYVQKNNGKYHCADEDGAQLTEDTHQKDIAELCKTLNEDLNKVK